MNSRSERPGAVLFDYGGVLVDVSDRPEGFRAVSEEIFELIAQGQGTELSLEDVEEDLRAGGSAYSAWKHAQSRRSHPREVTAREFWEFTIVDWPTRERALVEAAASRLCRSFELSTLHRPLKPGVPELLRSLSERGLRLGIVSNCLSGDGSRAELERHGIDRYFDVLVYSIEVGMRKPDPDIINFALSGLGVDPKDCWLLGDTYDRDLLGAKRAGLGKSILVRSDFGSDRLVRGVTADAILHSPVELLDLLA